ncbi:TolC family outer membrane protein [Paracoccus pacificus]|uniref:TolC family outer membrane protein n=1 Tax=Paracoccus pacificus TaxID=1463598 RepID=A0ABW4RCB9_9RHOB
MTKRGILRALRRPVLAALLVGATVMPSWAESLADAMVSSYRTSSLLDQNRALLRAADEDVAAAVAAVRPIVTWALESQYMKSSLAEGKLTTAMGLTASITLFDFGRSELGADIAKETVLATRELLINIEQSVLLNAVQAYLDVRSASQQVELQRNSVRVIGEEERAARDRFEVGEITRTDVSQAEAALAQARASSAAAVGQLEVASEAYKAITGHYPKNLSAPPPLPKMPATLEAAQTIAQKTHPAIRQAQRQAAVSELQVELAAAQGRPTLSGSATAQLDQHGNRQHSAGLSLSQTLYSGGRVPAAHRKAMAQRDAARAQLLSTAKSVTQQVGTAWANISVARAQIQAINEQIAAAQLAYDGVREEATLGARTTLDVLDAEQSLLEARANKITADADLQLAHYQLLSAMGLLTVENLKLGIPTYDPSAYYNSVKNAPHTSTQGQSLDRVLRAIGKQ